MAASRSATLAVSGATFVPIEASLAAMRARLGDTAAHGVHPGLIVGDGDRGWTPATRLTDGARIPQLIDTAKQRWGAQAHAAAALAWKSYTYWLALPAVVGYAAVRRVPLLHPEQVVVDFHDHKPFLTIGLRRPTVAVLPSDPIAGAQGVVVVPDDAALLALLRESLLDAHLDPVLEHLRAKVHLGRRTLLGSLASGVAYGIARAQGHLPASSTVDTIRTVLDALDVADLVSVTPAANGTVEIRRHTCCLAFTLPEPKICTSCVLR